ncbi:hypothetical protein Nepgr_004079 [Nepenthes gracilis]|uniref:Coenzyme Q-binding protein COQ10 START domain-containing protein n=1 Tax=Nepenthes gracilis TaxID=150966 RepID=A0AAD3S0Q3_NEPGR|nr:hypothetical protein Nepgr_004079 [Nepenthes gracilis]
MVSPSTAAIIASSSSALAPLFLSTCFVKATFKYGYLNNSLSLCRNTLRTQSVAQVFYRLPCRSLCRNSIFSSSSSRPLVMEWQDCTVKMEVNVPTSVAYKCYSDREAMPRWMPFISSVKTLEDQPDLSRWSLKYEAFGRNIEFSWLARNLQPIPNQKIHWISLEGLPNRGAVRFYPNGPSSCIIELTVSYEIPQILVPVASALQPFLEGLLTRGLERFSRFAQSRQPESNK